MNGKPFGWTVAVAIALTLVVVPPAFGADYLYWTNLTTNNLSFFALDASSGGDIAVTGTTVSHPRGIAIDPVTRKMYWVNLPNGISFANLDGSGGGNLNLTGATLNGVEDVAIDPTGGKVYWTNFLGNTISYASLDGSGGGGELSTAGATVSGPKGIAVDSVAGRIYWANYSASKISYANLNGTGGADLTTGVASVANPTGVAIDPFAKKIYWANISTLNISYASLSGSGGGDLVTTGATVSGPDGMAIDPLAGKIYWANFGPNKISYANLDGSGGSDMTITGVTVSGTTYLALLHVDALVFHNGFDPCWSTAVTKQSFLGLQQSAINNVTSCVPQSAGVGYTACSLPNCPNNAVGCPVTTHAGPFSGAFAAGSGNHYTSSGSAADLVIDIAYTGDSCTITASNIALDYALDYTFRPDGNDSLYAASLDQSTLNVHDGYILTGSNLTCQTLAAAGGSTLVSQIETDGAAGIAALEEPATVGQSVCPLTP